MKALKNDHNQYLNFQNKQSFTIKPFLIFFEIVSPARPDSGTASYATASKMLYHATELHKPGLLHKILFTTNLFRMTSNACHTHQVTLKVALMLACQNTRPNGACLMPN